MKRYVKLKMTDEGAITKPHKMTKTEKTARLYRLAKKLGVKIGGDK